MPKIKHLVWKVCSNALATAENLLKRNCGASPTCVFCRNVDNTKHLLLVCSWTRIIWLEVLGITCFAIPCSPFDNWLWCIVEDIAKSVDDWKSRVRAVFYVIRYIWKHWNEVNFEGKRP